MFLYFLGISGKSQVLLALVFTTRYLDLFTVFISAYNTVMKVRLQNTHSLTHSHTHTLTYTLTNTLHHLILLCL